MQKNPLPSEVESDPMILKRFRLKNKVTLQDISRYTGFPEKVLAEVEVSAYEKVSLEPIYIKFIIKSYAKLMRLPSCLPLQYFDSWSQQKRHPASPQKSKHSLHRQTPPFFLAFLTTGLLIILCYFEHFGSIP
jgi:cytoskeletal protein RodZ